MFSSTKNIQWNNRVGIIIILLKVTYLGQCYFCDGRVPYFPVYYPKAGGSFILDAVGFREEYSWQKDGKPLALQTCNDNYDPNCTQRIYLLPNRTDLNFKKITLEDSGKYILEMLCPEKRASSFEIFVQDRPFVVSDCKDMTVNEGENITCVCKTTDGHSSAEVTWTRSEPHQKNPGSKILSGILRLENISKSHGGTYTCFAKSQDFPNTTSFHLEVMSEMYEPPVLAGKRVEIESFDVFQNAGARDSKLTMICKASGMPQPKYTILHNGIPVAYGEKHIIDKRKQSNLGQYECMADNSISSDERLVFLMDPFFDKEKKTSHTVEINCKIVLIAGAGSFTVGILLTSILIGCFKKFTKGENSENSDYDDVMPQRPQVRLGLNSANHEMRLPHISTSPGSQELHYSEEVSPDYINVGRTGDHAVFYDNESSYQELSGLRETDDERYESLNDINV